MLYLRIKYAQSCAVRALAQGLPFSKVHMLTILVAACVAEAVKTVTGLSPQIKWVNDVLLDGQKICGILSEAAVEGETGALNFVVVGIGINIESTKGFPALQGNTAAVLREHTKNSFSRCTIIAKILNNLEKYYFPYIKTQESHEFLQSYRNALCILGKEVTVQQGDEHYTATVTKLSKNGTLWVRDMSGKAHELFSGEVSVKL